MAVDTATTIAGFDTAKPAGGDGKAEGDDNLRHIKTVLKTTFPNVAGVCNASHTEMNYLVGVTSLLVGKSFPKFTGVLSVGPTPSYTYMTAGIILDQEAADDEILNFRSTDIAHGITTLASTDTYGTFKKYSATLGGANFTGYTESTVGVGVRGVVVTEDGTRSTAAVAPVMLSGAVKSGTTSAAMSADKNVVVITDGTNARFIFDSDGDSHQDVGSSWTNYDHLDDVATLDALAYNVARADDPIKRKFGEWMQERREALTEQNIVTFNENGRHFINWSRANMLVIGAVRQLGERIEALEKALLLAAPEQKALSEK